MKYKNFITIEGIDGSGKSTYVPVLKKMLEELGYNTKPKFDELRGDIVQTIIFNDEEKLIKFCQGKK